MAIRSHLFLLVTAVLVSSGWTAPRLHAQEGSAARSDAKITGNPEHGRYIAEHVAMCVECHSGRDESGSILESQKYLGAPLPLPGPPPAGWAIRVPRNRGLPGYTDDQAMRLLTDGAIGREGNQLKLPMPRFRMTRQDAADVIAFLRSLR